MDWDQVILRSLDDLRNYDATTVRITKTKYIIVHYILSLNPYVLLVPDILVGP